MSVISRSYPKNVLLSSSSLIRRRTSVPRVYNARRCLKRSTVDTPARRLYLLALCPRVSLCAGIVTYSSCKQLGTSRQSRCRGRRSRYDISCPPQPTCRTLIFTFKMNKFIFKIWMAWKHGMVRINKPFQPDRPFAQISNFVTSPQRSDVAACSARRCWPFRPRSPPLRSLIVDRQRFLQRLL